MRPGSAGALKGKIEMKKAVATLAWVAGICLAGNDGDLFPAINFIGLVVFLFASREIVRRSACEK